MPDEPQLNQPEDGEQPATKAPEPSTRDLLHEAAEDKHETHSAKRKKYRERILDSLSQEQDTDGKSAEEIYKAKVADSYQVVAEQLYKYNSIGNRFVHEARTPTSVTANGTEIYVLGLTPSISSLIAYTRDYKTIYQLIQLPPVEGKVKIVGLSYSPYGFNMSETEADAEKFEGEGALYSFLRVEDEEERSKYRLNAPILEYFEGFRELLGDPDDSLPFFVSPENVKLLTEGYFPYLSDHPDVLSGPLPDFNSIEATYIEPHLPTGNDPESVKVREIHYNLEGLAGQIEEAFTLAALERPGSEIQFIERGNRYKEIRYGNQFRTYFLVRWNSEQNKYEIFKHPEDRPHLEQSFTIYTEPGKPFRGSFDGENKKLLYEFSDFINDLRKTLRQEADAKKN